MYAVVANQTIDPSRSEEIARNLRERVVPAQRALPGCSDVVHLLSEDRQSAIVILILDTEGHARDAAATIATPAGAPVVVCSTNIYEVSARA
jgi:hypothetical protein